MKQLTFYLFISIALLFTGCEYDNLEEPEATLEGQIVYNGEPIGLRHDGVQLELWQHNYELFEKIPVHLSQDGTFSAKLFTGDYKLSMIQGNGPWLNNTDSLDISLTGNQSIQVEVAPFYTVSQPSYSANGGTLTAQFAVNGINTDSPLEFAAVYMGRVNITDNNRREGEFILPASEITLGAQSQIDVEIPQNLIDQGNMFVRVGVKTLGVPELLFSQVEKIEL